MRKQYLTPDNSSSVFPSESLYWPRKAVSLDFRPKVSVIVPSYNHARFLRQRLDSIYQQTYSNFEVILLDDASTDESQFILEEYRQRYPRITRCVFNEENSGGVFNQWRRGLEIASGDLVWIAESDDYCSENLVSGLMKYFADEAVMLAYCRTTFVGKESDESIWSIEEYLGELDPDLWRNAFVMSASPGQQGMDDQEHHTECQQCDISSSGKYAGLLGNEKWRRMRICGDWIFYLHLVRGGLIPIPEATNFYRLHQTNMSLSTYNHDVYYQEHEYVAAEVSTLYQVNSNLFARQQQFLKSHWLAYRTDYSEEVFRSCYDYERIRRFAEERKPNLLMVSYALTVGGRRHFRSNSPTCSKRRDMALLF